MSYKKVGNYLLIKSIGKGAAGEVFLGLDTKKPSLVAVKAISAASVEDIKSKQIFKQSIHILNSLSHKNIINLISQEKTKNNYYLVLDYANGGDLYNYLVQYRKKHNAPLPEEHVQKIVIQIADGLEYMHKKNIIHRDIKLENILINYDNKEKELLKGNPHNIEPIICGLDEPFTIKIADVGFARELIGNTNATSICGTPSTMAPDILLHNSKGYNTSVDLWSLGAVTFELIIGEPPFRGDSIKEIFEGVQKGKYSYPNNIDISIECISFINGLLQFDPMKRMDWSNVRKHPFLTGDTKKFRRINIGMCSKENKLKEIEMNSRQSDNFLWLIYKDNNKIGVDLDKIEYDWIKNDVNMSYYEHKFNSEEDNKKDNKDDDWEIISNKNIEIEPIQQGNNKFTFNDSYFS